MPKNGLNVSLNSYDDIFSTEETRQEEQREQVQQIPIDELYPFKDHPFKVIDDEAMQRTVESMADTQNAPSLSQAQRLKKLAQEGHFSYDVAFAVMGEPKKDELDKVVIKNDTLRKYFPESSTPREMEEKIIGLLEESKTEKVVFRSDSIKKYFPSNYSSEQIENSILKMLDQRMKKRKHEAER